VEGQVPYVGALFMTCEFADHLPLTTAGW
jgi:hypothetical protein